MKLRTLLLAGLCVVVGQARAGLFNDDEARLQIQQVGVRVSALEEADKKQAEINSQQTDTDKQQTRTMLDLQSQIDNMNAELRSLRGQNEELTHSMQDADKRQKDFYIDLDTRLRHFETVEAVAPPTLVAPVAVPAAVAESGVAATDDPAVANRAYEAGHSLFKAGKHQDAIKVFQEFLGKFPDSVYVPNAHYEMGADYFVLNDYQNALSSYQLLVKKYAFSPKAPEAMLGMVDCQQELKDAAAVKKTLKQLIAKFPASEAASEAKKRLATLK